MAEDARVNERRKPQRGEKDAVQGWLHYTVSGCVYSICEGRMGSGLANCLGVLKVKPAQFNIHC